MGGFGEMAGSRLEARKDQGEPEAPCATKDGCDQGWGSSQEAMSFAKSGMIWLSKQKHTELEKNPWVPTDTEEEGGWEEKLFFTEQRPLKNRK